MVTGEEDARTSRLNMLRDTVVEVFMVPAGRNRDMD